MKPTMYLTERRPHECRLTREDIAFLLEHASHLRLSPTSEDGLYRLTPTHLIGVMEAPSCRLVIRPKLPLPSLAFLLDSDAPLSSYESIGAECDSFGVLDFLALRLTQRVAEQVRIGLQQGYREEATAGLYLQGRLDVPAQLRDLPRFEVIHSRHDDWTTNILCNQLLRSSLEMLARSSLLGESIRPLIDQTLSLFDEISAVPPTPEAFVIALESTPSYRPLLELARLAAEGRMGVAGSFGTGTAFLLNMERLFERLVSRGIREAFQRCGFTVREQETITVSPVRLRPDIIVNEGETVRLVIDAKWKRSRPGSIYPADFYQAVTYAVGLKAEQVVLVYPGKVDEVWTLPLPSDSPRVEVRTLSVTSSPIRNLRSLTRLAEALLPVRL